MSEKEINSTVNEENASPVVEDVANSAEGQTAPPSEGGKKGLKLNYKITFRVGLAFAIIMLFWTAYDFVVPLLLENAYGLPNWARGLIMGLDNILSLFMLPVFGKLSDKADGKIARKWGRRTPFIVVGTLCSVLLMVFVPVVTLHQQELSTSLIETRVEQNLSDDAFMEPLLTDWYDKAVAGEQINEEGAANYCDLGYLNQNDVSKEQFVSIRFYDQLISKKAVLNFIGAETFYWDADSNGKVDESEAIADLSVASPVAGKTYQQLLDNNNDYKKYVKSGVNNYKSYLINTEITTSDSVEGLAGVKSLAVYMVILLLVLIAMATFRSPAVALMPDVTPKPLRSQANAIINLMGGLGGAIAFLIYTVVLFGERLSNYVIIFASVAGGMLLLLAGFLALVKERKLVARCENICKEYGIDDFDEDENPEAKEYAEKLIAEGAEGEINLDGKPDGTLTETTVSAEELEFAKKKTAKHLSPKEWWSSKTDLEKGRLKSFILILASIFMWFMGYNAVSSNLSVYTTKGLNLSAGVASIISGVSMGISAIAFIPVGFLAVKIGRRKSIMLGFGLAVISFVLICFAIAQGQETSLRAVLFALFYLIAGFGLIIANVNTFPMVTELSTSETVGQYTGYYYVATMSAQAITPMLGGLVMDYVQDKYLFLYSAACIVIAIVLMAFVKHGDSKQIPREKKMTKEEKKQVMLDSMDSAD